MAISINFLYDGMEVQEDIFDADAIKMLVKSGTTLNDNSIRAIKSINENRDTIYVSGNTYSLLIERGLPLEISSRLELEEKTGYAAVKDKTLELLNEIANDRVVQQEALYSVSAELSHRLEVTSPSVVLSLINALAPIDEYLQRHCINVSLLNGLLGRWLGLPKRDIDSLVLIGLLHDCGKALIPPQVLNAPRKLTVAEFEVIKMHPVYTYELLNEFPEPLRRATRYHHEKVGGAGYPEHLSIEKIPLESCITAVSDIYDAMVSQRAYKKPQSPFTIMAVLEELKGLELDAKLVSVFNRNMPLELMDKPVMMSNGTIGIVRSFDPDDIEYPMVEVNGSVIKSGKNLSCTAMYNSD